MAETGGEWGFGGDEREADAKAVVRGKSQIRRKLESVGAGAGEISGSIRTVA
jgi:hypothetical protein